MDRAKAASLRDITQKYSKEQTIAIQTFSQKSRAETGFQNWLGLPANTLNIPEDIQDLGSRRGTKGAFG